MAQPTPGTVTAARSIVAWAIRAAAVVLLAVGGYLFLKKLLFALGNGPGGVEAMFRVFEDIGEGQSTYRGVAMLLVGTALAVFARKIARWVVSMPDPGCPQCGYAGAGTDTCPECGLRGLAGGGAREPGEPF